MLPAGKRDRLIKIRVKAETLNSRGDPIPATPTIVATMWARFEDVTSPYSISGREGPASGQKAFANAAGHWAMGYRTGVLTTMEIEDDGVIHDIVSVDESQKRAGELHVYTTRRAA